MSGTEQIIQIAIGVALGIVLALLVAVSSPFSKRRAGTADHLTSAAPVPAR